MAGWHHQLNAHEFEQNPGDGERQGILACCSPCKESDMTESLKDSDSSGTLKTCGQSCVIVSYVLEGDINSSKSEPLQAV